MQAIITRYHGPTSTKPARISARTASGKRIMVSRHGAREMMTGEDLHRAAAERLCRKLGWPAAEMIGGGAGPDTYVFTFATAWHKALTRIAASGYAEVAELAAAALKDSSPYAKRLEYLRGELRAERISTGELVELQSLAEFIEPGDVELLEAAGVPEGKR